MFTLTIETGNDAFAGIDLYPEMRKCFTRVLAQLTDGSTAGKVRDTNGNTVGSWSYSPDVDPTDYPEGTTAECEHCGESILLDQREGGGPGKDWGANPDDWTGNGGTGMDYGCSDSPDTDDDGTGGHSPDLDTITLP